jgi:hypothetical protein
VKLPEALIDKADRRYFDASVSSANNPLNPLMESL